jgi:hypothetical protein
MGWITTRTQASLGALKAWTILTLVSLLAFGGPSVPSQVAPSPAKDSSACDHCSHTKAPCSSCTNCGQACPLCVTLGILVSDDASDFSMGSEAMKLDPERRADRVCYPPPVPPPRIPVC